MVDYTSQTVIYPNKDNYVYQILLLLSKIIKALGLFAAFDVLRKLDTLTFLLILKLSAAILLVLLQKPFSSGSRLKCSMWLSVMRYSFIKVVLDTLWIESLILCGPFRFILLFEHCEFIVLASAGVMIYGSSDTSKIRGTVMFVLGIICTMFFDHDLAHNDSDHPEGVHKSLLIHKVYEFFNNFGLSDHKVGVLVLLVALCLDAGHGVASRALVAAVGGGKRLHALASLSGLVFVVPLVLVRHAYSFAVETSEDQQQHQKAMLAGLLEPYASTALLTFWLTFIGVSHVVDFYLTNLVANRLGAIFTTQLAKWGITLSGLGLCFLWSSPRASSNIPTHSLSAGVFVSTLAILYASSLLTSGRPGQGPDGSSSGHFIGYSLTGLPMFTVGQTPSHGMALLTGSGHESLTLWAHVTGTLRHIVADPSSLRIFVFLCLNLAFTFVELLYGVWTNSLGLISDGFHMLFDSAALVGGLYAAVVAHWKPTRVFSYGFHSAEVLSGFVNALFLLVISGSVFVNALARIHRPPHIETERLMAVSVAGLAVNLVGIVALGHTHSHGHGHSHEEVQGTRGHHHQHNHGPSSSGGDTNLRGVYLHVLADTLGSVGVIVSSFLVSNYGWNIADPICSVFIASAIFFSALPLLHDTLTLLTLQAPADDDGLSTNTARIVHKLLSVDGVLAVNNPFVWSHTRTSTNISISVEIDDQLSEQVMLARLEDVIKRQCSQVKHLTIQIEKSSLLEHFQALQLKRNLVLHYPRSCLLEETPVGQQNGTVSVDNLGHHTGLCGSTRRGAPFVVARTGVEPVKDV